MNVTSRSISVQFHWSYLTVEQSESNWIYSWKEYNKKKPHIKNEMQFSSAKVPIIDDTETDLCISAWNT